MAILVLCPKGWGKWGRYFSSSLVARFFFSCLLVGLRIQLTSLGSLLAFPVWCVCLHGNGNQLLEDVFL